MIIDITNEVFTKLKTELTGVTLLTSYPQTIPSFPCVIFEELNNNQYDVTHDSSGEHHNDVSFEINIFSNAKNKMTVVKGIRNQVDAIMSDLYGMSRDYSNPTPNYLDVNVYRYTLRYSAIIDENKTIWRK